MKTPSLIFSATAVTALSLAALAAAANAAGMGRTWTQQASRAEVAFQCHANNGTAYNLNGAVSGYGCVTATGSIHCDGKGNCRASRFAHVVPQSRATFPLPQPRLR